ncbi:hypothetical protein PUR49_32565 [Streptomyces sp. BE147]|uniref:hypothetical protein n=1 Tax=Streptomyces sp. BE147 TaxID=3002524 RepID=UPI002E763470|nr:hypothetical protein [Streptomyces sp. BE147]MEE1741206.1 hypothetical protein [Streptomyces sp. BE147]
MPSAPSLSELFLDRLSKLPENITFRQIAGVTRRDVDAVMRWQKLPGFPPEVDRGGPHRARRFDRDLFGAFYISTRLSRDEAGTAPGPKAADALGEIPDIRGLHLTATEIAVRRKVTGVAVRKAAASYGFPEPVGVRSAWRTVKLHLERTAWDDVPEKDLLQLVGVKRSSLEGLVEAGLVERTPREVRYRLTPEGRRNSPRLGTMVYVAWDRLRECYPRSLHIEEILKSDVKRTNFAAMVARGQAELVAFSYRLTDKGRTNNPDEEDYGYVAYEYDAAEVAAYFRGELQDGDQHLGPMTAARFDQWAEGVGDTCTRAEIAQAARRSEQWVASRLKGEMAPAPVGHRRRAAGTAYEYDTLRICDWLKDLFFISGVSVDPATESAPKNR